MAEQQHIELYLKRMGLLLQRQLRRYGYRLAGADGRYTKDVISRAEIGQALGLVRDGDGEGPPGFLDEMGIEPLGGVEERLRAWVVEAQAWLREQAGSWLPLEELRAGFRLSEYEVDMLMLAALSGLSVAFERVLRVVILEPVALPTVGFLAECVADAGLGVEEALSLLEPDAPLVRYRLVELGRHPRWAQSGATPRLHNVVTVPQRVLDFLRGARGVALPGYVLHGESVALEDVIVEEGLRGALVDVLRRPRPRVHLTGPSGVGRRTLLCALSGSLGQRVLEVGWEDVLRGGEPARVAEVLREARMHGALLLLRAGRQGGEASAVDAGVRAMLAEYPGGIVVTSEVGVGGVAEALDGVRELAFPPPSTEALRGFWARCLAPRVGSEERAGEMAAVLAPQYRVTPGAVVEAVEACAGQRTLTMHRLLAAVREQFHHGLGWLADPVEVTMGLNDVVMTEAARGKVEEILLFARHAEQVFEAWGFAERGSGGRGLSALFSGPPGTGKTLVAGVIAKALGRVLYRVDVSRIVDKYIGETEKNLGRVFDEAERAQAVLLFDEADSLFAKRTEVKSSNDRYANLEVGFLLQRMDDFAGVSILTTNLAQSIDEAFQRRIRFKIEFPMPDEAMRGELWRRLMPPRAPVREDVRWEELGEGFELSGGHIRNAILRAAMVAAACQKPISERMLWEAALEECREMGVLVADSLMHYDGQGG